MKITLIDINKLKPYPQNAKKHPPDQVLKIASSIKEFGFNQPIVVEPDFTIIAGHGRWLASKELGLKKVPVFISELTGTQAKAARLADNKLNESPWDSELFKISIEELLNDDYDIAKYDLNIDGLIKELTPPSNSIVSHTVLDNETEKPETIINQDIETVQDTIQNTQDTWKMQPLDISQFDDERVEEKGQSTGEQFAHFTLGEIRFKVADEKYWSWLSKMKDKYGLTKEGLIDGCLEILGIEQ